MVERLGDLCIDTIKDQITEKINTLLQLHFPAPFVLPPGRRIRDIATYLHQGKTALEELLAILRNLTELGLQSQEFQQILLYINQ